MTRKIITTIKFQTMTHSLNSKKTIWRATFNIIKVKVNYPSKSKENRPEELK